MGTELTQTYQKAEIPAKSIDDSAIPNNPEKKANDYSIIVNNKEESLDEILNTLSYKLKPEGFIYESKETELLFQKQSELHEKTQEIRNIEEKSVLIKMKHLIKEKQYLKQVDQLIEDVKTQKEYLQISKWKDKIADKLGFKHLGEMNFESQQEKYTENGGELIHASREELANISRLDEDMKYALAVSDVVTRDCDLKQIIGSSAGKLQINNIKKPDDVDVIVNVESMDSIYENCLKLVKEGVSPEQVKIKGKTYNIPFKEISFTGCPRILTFVKTPSGNLKEIEYFGQRKGNKQNENKDINLKYFQSEMDTYLNEKNISEDEIDKLMQNENISEKEISNFCNKKNISEKVMIELLQRKDISRDEIIKLSQEKNISKEDIKFNGLLNFEDVPMKNFGVLGNFSIQEGLAILYRENFQNESEKYNTKIWENKKKAIKAKDLKRFYSLVFEVGKFDTVLENTEDLLHKLETSYPDSFMVKEILDIYEEFKKIPKNYNPNKLANVIIQKATDERKNELGKHLDGFSQKEIEQYKQEFATNILTEQTQRDMKRISIINRKHEITRQWRKRELKNLNNVQDISEKNSKIIEFQKSCKENIETVKIDIKIMNEIEEKYKKYIKQIGENDIALYSTITRVGVNFTNITLKNMKKHENYFKDPLSY